MRKPLQVRGVIVPLLTPFTAAGEALNERALYAHTEWLIGKGVHGLMPCGTNGEAPLLAQAEREIITEIVVDAVRGRVPVIAHVGAATTRETIELACHAQEVGVEAISAVTPYYFRLPDQALIEHYCRLAEAVPDMPVFLYNIPQNTGNALSRAAAEAIVARCPNVIGIKDSAGNLEALAGFVGLRAGNFQVVCGSDSLVLPALKAGACASVSGNANVVPEVVVGIFDAFWAGDMERARRGQELLDLAREAMGSGGNLALLKAMADLRGGQMGGVRSPLPQVSPEVVAAAQRTLQRAGLLR